MLKPIVLMVVILAIPVSAFGQSAGVPSLAPSVAAGASGPIAARTFACVETLSGITSAASTISSATCMAVISSSTGPTTLTGTAISTNATRIDGTQLFVQNASGNTITISASATNISTPYATPITLIANGGWATFVWNINANAWVLTGGSSIDAAQLLTGIVPVARGGTSLGTLTNHALQVGAGTSAITQLAVGATGQVLQGNTGADPSWGAGVTSADNNFSASNTGNLASGTIFGKTHYTNSATLTSGDSYLVPSVVGVGTTFVVKYCSDGSTCASPNLTCTTTCTAAVGTPLTCTVNAAAIAAGANMSWSIATSCLTTDPVFSVNAHATQP